MSRDRARGSKVQASSQHSSSLLSSLGFKDPPPTVDSTASQHNRAASSSSQRAAASRRNSSSQLPASAADRRRASLLEQGGESGGNSPEISVVDSPRRAPPTIGPIASTGSPILAVQFGTRFLVLEPDVRGHVTVPSAGQVFRAPSQREIFALMDSPVASSLRPGLPPPRIAMLDELIAAVHAAGTGPLPVQFTSWRPPSSDSPPPPPPPPPPKRARTGATANGRGKRAASGLTTPAQSPSSQRNTRRPPSERVLPPKVMFKHMQKRASVTNSSSTK
ncbi:hypothetical protein BCR44DRAFT_1100805 [Catenaria anguillulae PL171]|uniref:Uncharacterized protein n=1 Tax=Catenaria anguillulae PL171 TaxID=765915 RepID=A0A1Y2I1R8_9FUNG|nr:hypothetical protein BCR44DRAFT_1100805 [Catenaria anguillulae PL171]